MSAPNAEQFLVGMVMHHPEILDEVDVAATDFADPRLELIWAAAHRLHTAGSPTDPVTLREELRGAPGIADVWLTELYGQAPAKFQARHYAQLVANESIRRRLKATATRIHQLADSSDEPSEVVEIARGEIDSCTRAVAETAYVADTIDATIDALGDAPTFTLTPWSDLNRLIGGWRPGAMYVVGARPGAGKTILGVQAAASLARDRHVALSSLEMSRAEIHNRLLAMVAGVPLTKLINRDLNEADWARIAQHRDVVAGLNLSVDDRTNVRPLDVRSHARSVARRGALGGVVVDYVGLMSTPHGERRPRHEVVAQYSRELKGIARDLEVPVIVLAQLNRESASRTGGKPLLSDLRESGALEQDADVALLLHVEDDDPGALHVAVAKNRHGPTGTLTLARRGHLARLDDMTRRY